MPVTSIVGAQWGDEGKGKITDLLAQQAGMVIRFGGGGNAGHTVVNEHGAFKLHHIPCGIFNPRAISLIGSGCVVDFDFLAEEAQQLLDAGLSLDGLRISSRAHVVMPYHLLLDRLEDEARGASTIGTTRRGVGPAYVDKADRVGIQVFDLLEPAVLRRKLELVVPRKNRVLEEQFRQPPMRVDDLLEKADLWHARFGRFIVDQVPLVGDALDAGREILLEGQLGTMRDLDWGMYPFVTSSTTIVGGGAVGGGIPPARIDRAIGVVKAYSTAVGTGPMPTELHGEEAHLLRERGDEYGATTGRPRRVGWFDAVAVRYSSMLNRFDSVAITKLDVLDDMPRLRICTAYRLAGRRYETVPPTPLLEKVEPEYEELPGWEGCSSDAHSWDELPANAQRYIERIEELIGTRAEYVSVGPSRDQTITLSTTRRSAAAVSGH